MSILQEEGRRAVKKGLCLLAALILGISLTGIYFCVESVTGFYSKSNVMSALTESNYAEQAYEQFHNKAVGILTNSFFDTSIAEEAFGREQFTDDLMQSVTSSMEGKPFFPDASQGRQKIVDELGKTVKSADPLMARAKELVIDEVSGEIAEYYENYTEFRFGSLLYKYRGFVTDKIKGILPILLLVGVMAGELIWLANRRKHRVLRYYLYASVSAVLVNIIMCIGILSGISIVPAESAAFYQDFVRALGHAALLPVFFVIAAGLILVVILTMVYRYERKKIC